MEKMHIYREVLMRYILLVLCLFSSLLADSIKLSSVKGSHVSAISKNYRIVTRGPEAKNILIGPDNREKDLSDLGVGYVFIIGISDSGNFAWIENGVINYTDTNGSKKVFQGESGENYYKYSSQEKILANGDLVFIANQYNYDSNKLVVKLNIIKSNGDRFEIDIPENLNNSLAAFAEEGIVYFTAYDSKKGEEIYYTYDQKNGFRDLKANNFNLQKYRIIDTNARGYLALGSEDNKIALAKYNQDDSKITIVKKYKLDTGSFYPDLALNEQNHIIVNTMNKYGFKGNSSDLQYLNKKTNTSVTCSVPNSKKQIYAYDLSINRQFFTAKQFVVQNNGDHFASIVNSSEQSNWCSNIDIKAIGTCAEYFDEYLNQIKEFPKNDLRCSFEVKVKDYRGKPLKGVTSVMTQDLWDEQSAKYKTRTLASTVTDKNGVAVVKVTFNTDDLWIYGDAYKIHAPYADKNYHGYSVDLAPASSI